MSLPAVKIGNSRLESAVTIDSGVSNGGRMGSLSEGAAVRTGSGATSRVAMVGSGKEQKVGI